MLGGLFETNLHLTLTLHELDRVVFWERPIAMTLLVLTVASVAWPRLRMVRP